jgi:hypothetical protein
MNTDTRRTALQNRLVAVIRDAIKPEAAEVLARDWSTLIVADVERVRRASQPENR